MYIIRAMKAKTNEYVDIGTFRSRKGAKDAIIKIANDLQENSENEYTIAIHMGVHQFTQHPKKGSPIIYYITID